MNQSILSKDYLINTGGFLKAPITKKMIKSYEDAHKKYQSYLDEKEKKLQREAAEKNRKDKE